MRLEADATLKFCKGDWSARLIYGGWKMIDSPYNTYMYAGLPPGPIRLPSVAALEAVLNLEEHDFIYMCARADFSGTHAFATSYEEHKENARAYVKALNDKGIK